MRTPAARGFTVGILLAAGRGSRFDAAAPGRKLDAVLPTDAAGRRVGEVAFDTLARAVDATVVATRAADASLATRARTVGSQVVVPAQAALGMGHSLAAAVAAAADRYPELVTLVIALADMPWLRADTINQLVDESQRANCIVQPAVGEQAGHPVVFPGRFAAALRACQGDIGAREVIQHHRSEYQRLAVTDTGVVRDIDRPEDLVLSPGVPTRAS